MQWYGALLPRLHLFMPAPTILEIGPGFGRWTHFLKEHCTRLIAVDVTPKCVEHCRERFEADSQVECHVNDGRSLNMVPSGAVDLVVTFDSLVHVEAGPIEGYVSELARVLGPDGAAVIHHSNHGSYPGLDNPHDRATSMTAERMAEFAERHGLACVGQELLDWGGAEKLIDCISIVARLGSKWERERQVLENNQFTEETRRVRRLAAIYGQVGFPGADANG